MPLQRLDDLDEQYVNVNLDDDDFSRAEHPHQADASPWLIILSLGLKKLMCSIIWRGKAKLHILIYHSFTIYC